MVELVGLTKNILVAYALTTVQNKYYVTFQDIHERDLKNQTTNLAVEDLNLIAFPAVNQEHYPGYVNESKLYSQAGVGTPQLFELHMDAPAIALKQFNVKFMAISSNNGVEIMKIDSQQSLKVINFNKPLCVQNMLQVSTFSQNFEKNYKLENGVALISYSYKNLYTLGISTSQDQNVLKDEKE